MWKRNRRSDLLADNVEHSVVVTHFTKLLERQVAYIMIKRVDGMDGFKVTTSKFLCDRHFTEEDIKRNPSHWRLKSGVVPSQSLYVSSVPTVQKKAPKAPSCRSLATTSTSATATDEAPLPPSFDFPSVF